MKTNSTPMLLDGTTNLAGRNKLARLTLAEELQRRPFVRPLGAWIMGVVVQICFPAQTWAFGLMGAVVVVLVLAGTVGKKGEECYQARWVWGVLFACIMVFLAVQMTAFTEIRMLAAQQTGWVQMQARKLQLILVDRLELLQLTHEAKAVLAALTLNYKQDLDPTIRIQFSVTGTAHLLSVSGYHVGIVYSLLTLLFQKMPKHKVLHWVKYIAIGTLLWTFAFIAGLGIPTVRAAIMLTIYTIGQALQLRPDKYNTLAAAALCMLVYNPLLILDVGFQLSFTAVFFILYLQPKFQDLIQVRNPLLAKPWSIITVTCAAQVGTVFMGSYYFGSCSIIFIVTNLALSFLATLLIPATLFFMTLPIPGVSYVLQAAVQFMTQGLMWFVERCGNIPWAALPVKVDLFTTLAAYTILLLWFIFQQYKNFYTLLAMLLTVLAVLVRLVILQM